MRYSEGVDTDVAEREWNEWLAKLGAFRQNFGHCRVPPKWPGDPGLAKWVAAAEPIPPIAVGAPRRTLWLWVRLWSGALLGGVFDWRFRGF